MSSGGSPIVVAIAESNGTGKTFYQAQLVHCGLRYGNADIFTEKLDPEPRRGLYGQRTAEVVNSRVVFFFRDCGPAILAVNPLGLLRATRFADIGEVVRAIEAVLALRAD